MTTPAVRLSDAARQAIETAADQEGIRTLRLSISGAFEHEMRFDEPTGAHASLPFGTISILLDPGSAERADGPSIDYVMRLTAAGSSSTIRTLQPSGR